MSDAVSRNWRLALGGALLALMLSGGAAQAQYYPPSRYGYDPGYPPGYVPYRGGYDRNYDRREFDYYRRRPPLTRDEEPARPRKARQERFDEPKPDLAKAPNEKPLKGPYHIVVSINTQRVSLYGSEGLIRTSGVSTGMRGHPTPMGVFTVIGKERYHRSNIYSNAPMPFMQRITWSGVALHEGVLPGYPASHGCIRMGSEFATWLWKMTKVGTRVIVTHDEPAPAEISNAKLFVPPPSPRATAAAVAAGGDGKNTSDRREERCAQRRRAISLGHAERRAGHGGANAVHQAQDRSLSQRAGVGVRQPQERKALRALRLRAVVRDAGDDQESGASARHPCLYGDGSDGCRHALDRDFNSEPRDGRAGGRKARQEGRAANRGADGNRHRLAGIARGAECRWPRSIASRCRRKRSSGSPAFSRSAPRSPSPTTASATRPGRETDFIILTK